METALTAWIHPLFMLAFGKRSGIGSQKSFVLSGFSHLGVVRLSYVKSHFLSVICEKTTLPGVSELDDSYGLLASCLEKVPVKKPTEMARQSPICHRGKSILYLVITVF